MDAIEIHASHSKYIVVFRSSQIDMIRSQVSRKRSERVSSIPGKFRVLRSAHECEGNGRKHCLPACPIKRSVASEIEDAIKYDNVDGRESKGHLRLFQSLGVCRLDILWFEVLAPKRHGHWWLKLPLT